MRSFKEWFREDMEKVELWDFFLVVWIGIMACGITYLLIVVGDKVFGA